MSINRVKQFIEDYEEHQQRKLTLYNRLMNLSGNDLFQEESLMQRLDKLEQQEDELLYIIHEADVLTDRQAMSVILRMEGKTLEEIGNVFLVSRERARQILNESYKLIADKIR